jgi:hypothetical protein
MQLIGEMIQLIDTCMLILGNRIHVITYSFDNTKYIR